MRGLVVAAVCTTHIASAEPYPIELVDRPLVTPDGGTGLEIAFDLRNRIVAGMRTSLLDDTSPDVSVWHAWENVEVGAGLGRLIYGWSMIDLGGPALFLGVAFTGAQPDTRHSDVQVAALEHKIVLVPSAIAVFGHVALSLNERRLPPPDNVAGLAVSLESRVGAQLQVERHLALAGWVDVIVPVQESSTLHDALTGNVGGEVVLATQDWDFYASVAIQDVTSLSLPEVVTLGLVGRFGI